MTSMRAFDPSKFKASAADYSSSSSDSEDDDFQKPSLDPRADDFADFNPRKRRRTGRDGKESAALGVFGSDSEDGGPSHRFKRKNLRTKGMSFVSSTDNALKGSDEEDVAGDGDDDDDDEEEDGKWPGMQANIEGEDEEEEEEEDDAVPGIGLGFKPSGGGLGTGWTYPGQGTKAPEAGNTMRGFSTGGTAQGGRGAAKSFLKSKLDGSNPLGHGFVPSSDNQPVLDTMVASTPSKPQVARPSAFSTKGGKTKINASSFGARMMAKMGYQEGQGLGARGDGRNVIIEQNLRPQRAGLGAVKEKTEQERQEEKRQAKLRGEVVVDSDEEEKKKKAERKRRKAMAGGLQSGSGSAASTPRRQQRPKYMTMDEVRKAAPGLNIPDAFTPILDLTGPGGSKKMLTSSSGLMTPTGAGTTEDDDDAQSKKMVKRAQNDFMAILEEWQGLQERKAFAELQLRQEQQEMEELEKGVESHQLLASIFDELLRLEHADEDVLLHGGDHTRQRWDQVAGLLRKAGESTLALTVQSVKEEMAATAVSALHPILKEMVENWNPLQSPRADYAADLKSIGGLLGVENAAAIPQARASATPYESMMYKIWLPHVSRAVRGWNVRDSDPMIAVYEAWHSVLPGFVKTSFLEQDIVRRLEDAIAKWEPKRKKHHSLPHLWLFPWLQHLPYHHLDPKSTTGLVADVKRKFRQLIDVWDFDRGVIPGLKEWKNVLRPSKANDQWTPLVMSHILPSMARYLRKNFSVEPSDQEPYLQVLTGVLEWRHVVSPAMVAEVIVAEVFPKWHGILYQWLVDENVSYEDIAQWCEWWHDADGPLPAEIRDTVSVASEFEKGLHTIERALDLFDLGEDPKVALAPPTSGPALAQQPTNGQHQHTRHQHHRDHSHHPRQQSSHATSGMDAAASRSFRHVIEDWCQENDLQFIPERKQHHSEGPLYRITDRGDGKGGKLGYFKGDKLCLLVRNGVEEIGESENDLERLMTHVM